MSVCDSSTGRTAEILSENKEKDEQAEIKEHDQMVKRMSHTRQTSQKIQYNALKKKINTKKVITKYRKVSKKRLTL